MERLLLNPSSLQHLAQIILAGVLAAYLFARSRPAGATRALARFFAALTAGLALLFSDQACVGRSAKVFIDAAPSLFQIAGALLLGFAYRFPDAAPTREARWATGGAWLVAAADVALAAPNLARSWRGEPNPVLPFRVQLTLLLATAVWIVIVFLRRARWGRDLGRRERGALYGFAGLAVVLLLVGGATWLGNLQAIPHGVFLAFRTAGLFVFLVAFVVVHLNASPEPSELMAKLVGLSLVATLLALALAAALQAPPAAPDPGLTRELQHRQALPFAGLMLGLTAVVLGLYPLLLRAGLRRPLRALLEGVRRVNAGDLAVEVPVRVDDEIGYLARSFNDMVRSVREAVAAREHAAAVERELEVARRIQEGLLPETLPRLPGLVAAARLVPATTMSGDFYDAVALDGELALLAVDVSGHGVPAALIAAMARLSFAQAAQRERDPGALLSAMNETLTGRTGGQFFTACCAVVDPATGRARLGNAGHPPALLLRDGQVRELKPDGTLAALFPGARFATQELTFAPGDRLLLVTDGVTECQSPQDEDFGPARLAAELRDGAGLAPDAFADRLLARLRAWSGCDATFADDVTVLVLDYRP